MPQTYRVKAPFAAVYSKAGGLIEAVVLEPGGIITVHSEHTVLRSGLVELLYGDQILSAYLHDIQDRAELVEVQASNE